MQIMNRFKVSSDKLTEHELRIAKLIATGLNNEEIAVKTGLTVKTIEGYVDKLYAHLEIFSGKSNRLKVALAVLKSGLVSVDEIQTDVDLSLFKSAAKVA